MNKYIEAEKLKAEIERLEEMDYPCDTLEQSTGFYDALERIRSFITSLQQKLPKTGLEVSEFCQPVPENIADCVAEHFWEMIDDEEKENTKTIETTHHEQTEDLEKFISDFFDKKDAENNGRWSEDDIVEAITKAYELGKSGKEE